MVSAICAACQIDHPASASNQVALISHLSSPVSYGDGIITLQPNKTVGNKPVRLIRWNLNLESSTTQHRWPCFAKSSTTGDIGICGAWRASWAGTASPSPVGRDLPASADLPGSRRRPATGGRVTGAPLVGQDGTFQRAQTGRSSSNFCCACRPAISGHGGRAPSGVAEPGRLSAEAWVEGCHACRRPSALLINISSSPASPAAGDLLLESGLLHGSAFPRDPKAIAPFLTVRRDAGRNGGTKSGTRKRRPGCSAWQAGDSHHCLAPKRRRRRSNFLGNGEAGSRARGALTVRCCPSCRKPDYDKLLWACDLNFVRGEGPSCARSGRQAIHQASTRKAKTCTVKLNAFRANATPKPGLVLPWDEARESIDWNAWPSRADLPEVDCP